MAWVGSLLFLAIASLLLLIGQTPAWRGLIGNIAINFLAIVVEALPFMLIGSLAGGLIEVFVPVSWVERVVRRHRIRAVFVAGALGVVVPVCECAIVPVVRRMLGKGFPLAASLTFLLAGPIVNPIVALSTAIAYNGDWTVPLVRLASGYTIAVSVGLLLGRWFNRDNALLAAWNSTPIAPCGHLECAHPRETAWYARLRHALEHAVDDFFSVGLYLVFGAFLSAFLRSTVPLTAFSHLLASPWLAIALAMIMAVLLNLCSEADAFIAASFRDLLPYSAQMAFMVLGPMLDLKLVLMYLSVFRKRLILALAVVTPAGVLLAMAALRFFLPDLR